jgi:hypothetical protein
MKKLLEMCSTILMTMVKRMIEGMFIYCLMATFGWKAKALGALMR